MEGFSLLVAHLIGDYIFQDDWQANVKVAQKPEGSRPAVSRHLGVMEVAAQQKWDKNNIDYKLAPYVCTLHCALYTSACLLTCFWFLSWWAYLVIFATHWPIDRYRLARLYMKYTNKEEFATGPLAPWSVIVIDNVFHIIVLYVVGMLSLYT